MEDLFLQKMHVCGRVQYVYFRRACVRAARKFGVRGGVRNLPNGCVEVLAMGAFLQVQSMYEWLFKGPILAKVKSVEVVDLTDSEMRDLLGLDGMDNFVEDLRTVKEFVILD